MKESILAQAELLLAAAMLTWAFALHAADNVGWRGKGADNVVEWTNND